jgi:hypothetical protein
MPDPTNLYPPPPSQPPNALLGDPAKLVGLASELQRMQILQQQAPALAQQPQANLDLTRANIGSVLQEQQAAAQKRVAAGLGSMIPDGAKADDVHSCSLFRTIESRFGDALPRNGQCGIRCYSESPQGHQIRRKLVAELCTIAG